MIQRSDILGIAVDVALACFICAVVLFPMHIVNQISTTPKPGLTYKK